MQQCGLTMFNSSFHIISYHVPSKWSFLGKRTGTKPGLLLFEGQPFIFSLQQPSCQADFGIARFHHPLRVHDLMQAACSGTMRHAGEPILRKPQILHNLYAFDTRYDTCTCMGQSTITPVTQRAAIIILHSNEHDYLLIGMLCDFLSSCRDATAGRPKGARTSLRLML